jgi:ATP-binding cassette subfamily F protein 3
MENMREVEKKDIAKAAAAPKKSNKTSLRRLKKMKSLQNRLSEVKAKLNS